MDRKTLIQILLIFLVLFLIGFFYLKYFDNSGVEKISTQESNEKKNDPNSFTDNIVKDIVYEKLDIRTGHKYTILADYGQYNDVDKEIIMMTTVKAIMELNDGTVVNLRSDEAKYNTINGNTNFIDNVDLDYLNHQINSDYMNTFFDQSLLEAYGNLVYRNLDYNLVADKVELNLITKDTKVFMLNNSRVIVTNN